MKKFKNFFSEYISEEIESALSDSEITSLEIDKTNLSIKINLISNDTPSSDCITKTQKMLATNLRINDVKINTNEIQKNVDIEDVVKECGRGIYSVTRILKDISVELSDDVVSILLLNGGKNFLIQKNIDKKIEAELSKHLQKSIRVVFKEKEKSKLLSSEPVDTANVPNDSFDSDCEKKK